jgi:hypothetical protein
METLTFQLDQDLSPTKETQNANHLRNHDDVGRGRQSDTYLIPMPHSIAVVHYGSKMYYYVSRGGYARWTQWYLSYGTSTPRAHSSSSLILQFPYCILILWTSAISDHDAIGMLYCRCAIRLLRSISHLSRFRIENETSEPSILREPDRSPVHTTECGASGVHDSPIRVLLT